MEYYIKFQSRCNGKQYTVKKEMLMSILNSMTESERKKFFNEAYGYYVDTDSVNPFIIKHLKQLNDSITTNINDIGTITEVVRLMLVGLLSNEDKNFKRHILEDAYNKLEDHASLFCFPPFD